MLGIDTLRPWMFGIDVIDPVVGVGRLLVEPKLVGTPNPGNGLTPKP
jgi:hypothetical protein